ncbi:MAG: glycoside hydrolase family 3 C-terminal domain-containing protein [Candidatus Goldiibacteriota bacterium]|jgi:beta-glucosidase
MKKYTEKNLKKRSRKDAGFSSRADSLLKKMTPWEKLSQMTHKSPAIPGLDIPEYNWWNEALHGVARAGIATVFPQAIGLAASFDDKMVFKIASAISDEGRAKYHKAIKEGNRGQYYGLTFWSPNINIFRDPRWGRGQETYGEDPFLTSRMGAAFIKGIQGNDKKHLKAMACAKHFAVHSGPDPDRHTFDARVSEKDLRETYLPAFETAVKEAGVECIMGAYNRVNGEPACASKILLVDILRGEWGFKGHVVSDCEAIDDIYKTHKFVKTAEEAAAISTKMGCDLNCCNEKCGEPRLALKKAYISGLLTDGDIDASVKRLLLTRLKLGMLNPETKVKYSGIPYSVVDCPAHKKAALEAARASIVLLKNNGVLPFNMKKIQTIAVIGPNSDDVEVLMGNYSGTPSAPVTPLDAFKKLGAKINYVKGCSLTGNSTDGFKEAVNAALDSDAVIFCAGLSPKIEGEECDTGGFERSDLGLPGVQSKLLQELKITGRPVILVLLSGSALSVGPECADAIIQAWYPGQSGGRAIADVITGKYNPAGRLPVTVYKSASDLPDFRDYNMENRTYRYFKGEPLYPFGFGLSYTDFEYSGIKIKKGKTIEVSAVVKNTGKKSGDEVVQLYVKYLNPGFRLPRLQLIGFQRFNLKSGRKKKISFSLKKEELMVISMEGKKVKHSGGFEFFIGGVQPGYEAITESTGVAKIYLNK